MKNANASCEIKLAAQNVKRLRLYNGSEKSVAELAQVKMPKRESKKSKVKPKKMRGRHEESN
jgi:hypothetical protein